MDNFCFSRISIIFISNIDELDFGKFLVWLYCKDSSPIPKIIPYFSIFLIYRKTYF